MQLIQVDAHHHQISAFNRAFQFGDGHFTTLLIENKHICLWHLHKARLLHANQTLFFPEIDLDKIEIELNQIAQTGQAKIVKILVSRGNSQRGYAIPEGAQAQVYLFISDYHAGHFSYPDGVHLALLTTQIGQQPSLAGLKHCNRLEQVLIKHELSALNATDGLVFDKDGQLIETSLANVFLLINDIWVTPDLSLSGVAGVMRQFCLDSLPDQGIKTEIRKISRSDLANASAGFITNALMKSVPIASVEAQYLDLELAQIITRKLNEAVF